MKKKSANITKRIAIAAAALAIGFAGSNGVCYAATGETWVEKVFVKVNGMDKEAIVKENEDGTVNYHIPLEPYQDGDNYVERSVMIVTDEEDIDDVSITYGVDGDATSITVVNENGETSTLE